MTSEGSVLKGFKRSIKDLSSFVLNECGFQHNEDHLMMVRETSFERHFMHKASIFISEKQIDSTGLGDVFVTFASLIRHFKL